MSEQSQKIEHKQYPIGSLSEKEVVDILTDQLYADDASMDEVMNDWRGRSLTFNSLPAPNLRVPDDELLPIPVKEQTKEQIESMLRSYRYYLPPVFDLALVPIEKLVMPQKYVTLEQVHSLLPGAKDVVPDDENASMCLGTPISSQSIDVAYLGSPRASQSLNSFTYLYQFSSEDRNMRYIPIMPMNPIMTLNLATNDSPIRYDAKVIPITVGTGLPMVHVLKVPTGIDRESGKTVYRLIIANGIHRIIRLFELGNTHVASLVQTINYEDIPNEFIDGPKDRLFVQKPLTVRVALDRNISRVFKTKKSKNVIRLQVTVSQEAMYIS